MGSHTELVENIIMAGDDNTTKVYKEEVTKNGAMIEVVLEEAKKKKRPTSARSRPDSVTSIRSLEDIERMQKAAEERRKIREESHQANLTQKKERAAGVRLIKSLNCGLEKNN